MSVKEQEVPGQQTQESQLELPLPTSENTEAPVGSATGVDFNHPLLKGKTPQQIEEAFKLMESTVREQGQQLSRRFEESQQPSAPAPAEQPVDSKTFWDNPVEVMQRLIDKQISPLRQEIRTATQEVRAPTLRERLRNKYSNYDLMEPTINMLLQRQGVKPESAPYELLETLYFTSLGYAQANGMMTAPAREQPVNTPTPQPRNAGPIPQHRPSPAPLPQSTPAAPRLRELTEHERRLAKEYFPGLPEAEQHRQYIMWQEADIEEVVNANFDQPAK